MPNISQDSCRNLLLRSLQADDFELLKPDLDRVALELDDVLNLAGDPIEAVYFPEAGILTFSDEPRPGFRVGIGSIGYDGMAGWPLLLGSKTSAHEVRVTANGGTGLRIGPDELLRACSRSEALRNLLLSFVQAFFVQLGQTVASSLTQSVETRLSRWALMAHDRVEGDEIKITHENVALMLAVRRATVTDAIHILEGERLIKARRGQVTILDRSGLLRRAGDTYGGYETEYSRLITKFPRRSPALHLTERDG
jgi:CRP-like cAMP-binding protein